MDVAERLRAHGHRVTTPRRAVWKALSQSRGHLTVEELHAQVRLLAPEVNVASVYRTITLFDGMGLTRQVRVGDGPAKWELAHPDDVSHLVCRVCDEVLHHPSGLVRALRHHLDAEHGFAADDVELVVHGVCADCRGERRAGLPPEVGDSTAAGVAPHSHSA